ncbi:TonB-dependent outer membrane receptor [Tenacibaculum maritimum]|uniref:TonB-dependent receptor n=1 Tax=Tenacibaculum maritimum TaxID=107401 RepID=UPI0012E4A8BB|nr:TonB-dependent receptor [Tenacibaculum maritimum]CAA0195746.1 TonB-dependent outer membrane receptor [Tenacibaculum maritimum]
MHIKNTRIFSFIIAIFVTYAQFITAQKVKKKEVLISQILNTISTKYQVFFTYNPNLLKSFLIDKIPFKNLSLHESINLLEKTTPFHFENLGNSYYVIYSEKDHSRYQSNNNASINYNALFFNQIKNSLFDTKKKSRILKGIVLSENHTPIQGANIIQKNTNNGTVSDINGEFSLLLTKNTPINISYIGYDSKTVTPKTSFIKIIINHGVSLDEIQIVGSRNTNRAQRDSPVATDIINIEKAIHKSGLTEINQLLQYSIPSFNATRQSGADGADHIVPATYRGLGPDQTLVLINGKRRHQASLINLYGTRGRGNSGTDLNAIPTAAIKEIEILKDGASAQYGSDAIAGVINLKLKDTTNTLSVNTTFGFYNANPTIKNIKQERKSFDGFTYKLDLNYGAKISSKGFLNISSEFLSKENTYRAGTIQRRNYGDAGINSASLFLNSEIPLNYKTTLYTFGGHNYRNTKAYAFTRPFDSERNIISLYPNGFNPLITSEIADTSISTGIKTSINNWSIDFNNTFGKNNFHYLLKNTLNATLLDNSPTEFDAGGHSLKQNTTSIDIAKHFSFLEGTNLAFGLEHRLENYQIFSGEEASYTTYDNFGTPATNHTSIDDLPTFNGIIRPGGSQGFPGYAPSNEVDRTRTNFSIYSDIEFDFTKKWMLGTALRYERYSDFGSSLNTKIATRIKTNPNFNLRGSFSTGFRAPSLAQIYYNLTFTNYIENQPIESLLIANNNPITKKIGIETLSEEKAINASLGVSQNYKNFHFSLDSYFVSIKDRIILSGNFDASNLDFKNVKKIQFFANGVNTNTFGIDIRANWTKQFNDSKLTVDFSGNINRMNIQKVHHKKLDKETFFGIREKYFLLASAPKSKFNLSFNYHTQKLNVGTNITRFNSIKLIDWQILQPLSNFNNSATERIKKATDTYNTKYTLDIYASYKFLNFFTYQFGINNLFNTYPTLQGNHTDSGGLWDSTQMGTNGSYFYSKIQFNL